jgi:hypothetical protein
MNWNTVIPVVAVILTAIVIVLLWYWWSTSRSNEPTDEPRPASSAEQEESFDTSFMTRLVESVRSVLPASVSSSLPLAGRTTPARQTGELVEAIKLYRDLATGGLVVELSGRRYFALSEMTDDTLRRRFIGIAESVAQFASGEAPTPAAPMMPIPVPAAPEPPRASAPATDESKKEPAQPEVLKSMSEEIEELLQYRLTITPELIHRSIHIRESHGGAIQVEVDGQYFDGVGDVPDEMIKNFLQDIIREWEARK